MRPLQIVDKDGTRVVPMPELDVKPVAGSGGKPDVISSSTSANSSSPAAAMSVE